MVLGETYKDQWIINSGLKKGDNVIAEGTQKVRPGVVVKTQAYSSQTDTGDQQKAGSTSQEDASDKEKAGSSSQTDAPNQQKAGSSSQTDTADQEKTGKSSQTAEKTQEK